MFQIWGDILDVHVYVWKSNLLFWQRSREPISSLYNSSLGQQNDLILWVFLLSRRCASSEPYPLFKPILRLWNPRTNCRICFSKRSLSFYWLSPRCGITAAYWSRVGITAAYWSAYPTLCFPTLCFPTDYFPQVYAAFSASLCRIFRREDRLFFASLCCISRKSMPHVSPRWPIMFRKSTPHFCNAVSYII